MNHQTGALMLVGDSDIARWPSELLPKSDTLLLRQTLTRGHSGATLQEIVPCVQEALEVIQPAETIVLVACAGENDIGSGCSLNDTLSALQELIRLFFRNDANEAKNKRLVFLGPKLEPWLDNDPVSRKKIRQVIEGVPTSMYQTRTSQRDHVRRLPLNVLWRERKAARCNFGRKGKGRAALL